MEVTETETGVKSPYNFLGFIQDKQQMMEWQAQDTAASDEYNLIQNMKKRQGNYYEDCIKQMRYMYQALNANQRQAFINRVVHEISKGR